MSKASRDKRGSAPQRRRRLARLWDLHDGICTKCKCLTGIARELEKEGFVADHALGILVHPDLTVAIATVEHIVPICRGGGNNAENLTLLCWNCNQENARILLCDMMTWPRNFFTVHLGGV